MDLTRNSQTLASLIILAGVIVAQHGERAYAVPPQTTPRPLHRIAAGTVIGDSAPRGWSEIVLYAKPRLGSGDVSSAPRIAASTASLFHLAVMAKINGEPGQRGLADLAIGYTTPIDGRNVVITSDTQQKLGANLGYIERKVLVENEKSLNDVKLICLFRTMAVFDAKAIVLHNDAHQHMVIRHVVWVASKDGRLATAVWLLENNRQGLRIAEDTIQVLPANYREDRIINVKADKFVLGVPTAEAFALARIPRGRPVKFTEGLARIAAASQYSAPEARTLAVELNAAIKAALRR